MAAVTHGNAGGDETLVATPSTSTVSSKGLSEGTGITLSSDASAVTITNSDPASGVTLSNAGSGSTLVNDGTGPALATKSVTAGSGIAFTTSATDISMATSISDVCIVYNSTDFTVTNTSTLTLTYDSEEYDPAAMHSTSSNQGFINVLSDGLYEIKAFINTSGHASATNNLNWYLYHHTGGSDIGIALATIIPLTATTKQMQMTRVRRATAGDYFFNFFQNVCGQTITIYSPTTLGASTRESPMFMVTKLSN